MSTAAAVDRLGAPVPTPARVDPDVWRRFTAHVVIVPGGCHLWTGAPRDDGYGQFWAPRTALQVDAARPPVLVLPGAEHLDHEPADDRRPRVWRAHRFAWSALSGPLTEDEHLCHQCDEPLCVPITAEALAVHLALGDNADNVADRESRGRGARPRAGLMWWGRADRRGQAARSRALHRALRDALAAGVDRAELPAVVAAVDAAGGPAEQPLPLPGLEGP